MPEMQRQKGASKSTSCVMIRMFLSSFWYTESSFVRRFGCFLVHQDKDVTYQFTVSRSPRRRGSRFWHFMPLLAVIRQASSMVWVRHRHGKSSKMHLTSWNTLKKTAKSVLTFSPKLKPLYANSTIHSSISNYNPPALVEIGEMC